MALNQTTKMILFGVAGYGTGLLVNSTIETGRGFAIPDASGENQALFYTAMIGVGTSLLAMPQITPTFLSPLVCGDLLAFWAGYAASVMLQPDPMKG